MPHPPPRPPSAPHGTVRRYLGTPRHARARGSHQQACTAGQHQPHPTRIPRPRARSQPRRGLQHPSVRHACGHNGSIRHTIPAGHVSHGPAQGDQGVTNGTDQEQERRCAVGVLDRFEKGVERVVNGAFAKAFRSELKPVEIASAIRRDMEERTAGLARDRTVMLNTFIVQLSTKDYQQVQDLGEEVLAEEMANAATDHATSQEYVFVGPVEVEFTEVSDLEPGRFRIRSASRRGAVAPATTTGGSSRHPIVDIDGQRYLLTGAVTVIGRGSEAAIIGDGTGVCRRHLEIRITPDGVVATDLGSTNGTYVEGHHVEAATLVDGNTLTIGRTRILFWSGT